MIVSRFPFVFLAAAGIMVISMASQPLLSADGSIDPRPAAVKAERILFLETFEGSWPASPWRVKHGDGAVDVEWGRSDDRASQGAHSAWCAQRGSAAPGPGGPVPTNTESWMIAGPFDLSDAQSAILSFDLWLETEPAEDNLMWLVSTDNEDFSGEATTTDTGGWTTITADLAGFGKAGSVLGSKKVWVAFVYTTDYNENFEGAYVDNVRLAADIPTPGGQGFVFSTEEDFGLGSSAGTEYEGGALTLSQDRYALPYLWIPNTSNGTISRIGTTAGDDGTFSEIGRYRTGPERDLSPVGVAVDLEGSCWVANRGAGTVVKIGREEAGGCVDRNDNGRIDTSRDANADGDISGSELLAWGADECVLFEVLLVKDADGTYIPGEAHNGYVKNNLQALAVDQEGNLWAGVSNTGWFYKVDGATGRILERLDLSEEGSRPYLLVIDSQGTLWSSNSPETWVQGLDPSAEEYSVIDLAHGSAGLALDHQNHLFVTGPLEGRMSRIDLNDEGVDWTVGVAPGSNGATVTDDENIWVAAAEQTRVYRYSNDGLLEATITAQNGPTAVAVDGDGAVWATGLTGKIIRIDPDLNQATAEKEIVDGGPQNASGDLTGRVARSITTHYGSWSVVHDSGAADAAWGTISWTSEEPDDTQIDARVRSSADQSSWSTWERARNGVALTQTPIGRYLQIEVALQAIPGMDPPRLEELAVVPVRKAVPPAASFGWAPVEPEEGSRVQFADATSGDPTWWEWDFGDGGSSGLQNPSHEFASTGSYTVMLKTGNAVGTDETTREVTVKNATGCRVDCSASVPAVVKLDQETTFTAQAIPAGCEETVGYSWIFGDGAGSTLQNPVHAYDQIGTYRWTVTTWSSGASCIRSGHITAAGEAPVNPSHVYWVPVVSHADGDFGSVWRSDVGLLGVDEGTAAVELVFHGPGAAQSGVASVASGAMVNIADVVDWIQPGAEASGALEVRSDGKLVVTSRTYSQLSAGHSCLAGGSLGTGFSGFESSAGLSTGQTAVLSQLRENDDFRTNIGLVNTGSVTAEVVVNLYTGAGAWLKTYTTELDPYEWEQENRPFARRAGAEDLDAAWAEVSVTSGSGVFAYATVTDNVTNDSTTIEMSR